MKHVDEANFCAWQKHHDALFPPIGEPAPEVLAQAALFVVLRDQPQPTQDLSSPWVSLASRRFGGDVHERIVQLQDEDASKPPSSVHLISKPSGLFDITVHAESGTTTTYSDVQASLLSPSEMSSTLDGRGLCTTIVTQAPHPTLPASDAPVTMERVHVFHGGVRTTLVRPSPQWLRSLGGDVHGAAKGALRAPMPSLIVEVKVAVGDKVVANQAVVVLESMKTETVLRAHTAGIVKAVGCAKGEMVEEGRELVDIEEVSEEVAKE